MVNLQPFWVATRACRNLDTGLQTGVVHGRHQKRAAPVSKQRRARMIPRSRVYQWEHVLPMSAASSQMRDSTPNEVVASCNAVVLLLRTARATSCAPNCDLVGINSGRFLARCAMEAQMEALGACGFVAEHTGMRLGGCRMCSDMYSGCTACLRSVFGGAVHANVADTHTDAVPHPCIRVVICSHTPSESSRWR